jgi:hypothetical protein
MVVMLNAQEGWYQNAVTLSGKRSRSPFQTERSTVRIM